MWGYMNYSVIYGAWDSVQAANAAAAAAGHYEAYVYEMVLSNDPRPQPVAAGRRLSGDAEFLALGR